MLKPGYKTTEFYATAAVSIGGFIASVAHYLPPRYALIGAAISEGLYGLSRGLAKVPTPIVPTTLAPPPTP